MPTLTMRSPNAPRLEIHVDVAGADVCGPVVDVGDGLSYLAEFLAQPGGCLGATFGFKGGECVGVVRSFTFEFLALPLDRACSLLTQRRRRSN